MILFLIYFYLQFPHGPQYSPQYGDILGWTKEGVVVFSNYKRHKNERTYAGEKWECVEFVRRFLISLKTKLSKCCT